MWRKLTYDNLTIYESFDHGSRHLANPDQADADSNGVGDASCCIDRGNVNHSGVLNASAEVGARADFLGPSQSL